MTTSTFSDTPITSPHPGRPQPQGAAPRPSKRPAGRAALVAVMIAALLGAGFARNATVAYQQRTSTNPGTSSAKSALGGMNTFAVALLLGGLRGPLVMVLWTSSENQKVEKDLEDFNTKVEWIRNLQPEFDSVHLFQIWNLAYNISVQMASLPNRYAVILESLDYARSVDRSRPDNLNILHQTAQVYSNKLGTVAQEKSYYRRRVREDSLPRKDAAAKSDDSGFQRRRMQPLLDEQFRVRQDFLVVRHPRPAGLADGAEWNTGEEMQFLPQFEPYPQGVSTYALAYNYAKRAQVVMDVSGQKPLQLSTSVIDSRPALELKAWAEDDMERGRASELRLYGVPVPTERVDMDMPTASLPPDRPFVNAAEADNAIYSYRNAARVASAAIAEYRRHLSNPEFVDKTSIYASHIDGMEGIAQLATADAFYLQAATTTDPAARQALLTRAATSYRASIGIHELTILRYFVDDEVAAATYSVKKSELAMLSPERRRDILAKATDASKQSPNGDTYSEDRPEYENYIARANARLKLIGQ